MYKRQSKQLTILDFGMPLGMELRSDNEWVQRSRLISWDYIEEEYMQFFLNSKTGNVAKHSRLVLGALIIQRHYGYSDRKLVSMIRDTPCLQYFCGLPEFKQEAPFNASSLVNFRKRVTPEFIDKINEKMISTGINVMGKFASYQQTLISQGTNKWKKVTLNDETCLDSTACPQYITFPTDIKLIYAVLCNLLKMLFYLHDIDLSTIFKREIRDTYLKVIMNNKRTKEDLHIGIGKLLDYVFVLIQKVEHHLSRGNKLPNRFMVKLPIISKIYEQQTFMLANPGMPITNRIISLSAWWASSIYRNKDGKRFEYGSQFDISTNNDFVRIVKLSFSAYNEECTLPTAAKRYFDIYGHYPSVIIADTKYRNEKNRQICKNHNIKLPGIPLGKNKNKDVTTTDAEKVEHKNKRTVVERKFSYVKGSFGLDRVHTFHPDTTKAVIYLGVFAMNLETAYKYAKRMPEFILLLIKRLVYEIISPKYASYGSVETINTK
jgi:hypothetical protein